MPTLLRTALALVLFAGSSLPSLAAAADPPKDDAVVRPADRPLDPRIDPEKVGRRGPAPLPQPVLLPLPPDHAIAAERREVPISAAHWDRAERALARGLTWLVADQAERGAWMAGVQTAPTPVDGVAPPPAPVDVAVTAMVVKALAQGRSAAIDRAAVDTALTRGLAFVQSARTAPGDWGGGPLANYVTSSVVSALAGLDPALYGPDVAAGIKRLTTMQWDQEEGLDPTQDWFGGAGYGKHGRPDLSNTQMMTEALYDAGLSPDEPAFQRALAFLSRTQNLSTTNDAAWSGDDGGFIYSPARGGESMASEYAGEGRMGELLPDGAPKSLRSYGSMTYAGFKSMLYAGLSPDDPRVKSAFAWIRSNFTFQENPGLGQQGYFYYLHVMARALRVSQQHQITDDAGVTHDWREELIDALVARQRADGAWTNPEDRWLEAEPALATAYALLALEEALKPVTGLAPEAYETAPAEPAAPAGPTFSLSYPAGLLPGPSFSGRVYVLFADGARSREPRFGPGWFSTTPFLARDVADWRPDETLVLDARNALTYPGPIATIPQGGYAIQAVLRRNPDSATLQGAGNLYSDVAFAELSGSDDTNVELELSNVIEEPAPPPSSARLRWFEMRSPLLSAFHGRDITMRAAVWLPEGYDAEAERTYPVAYTIGGFGSDHLSARWMSRMWQQSSFDDRLARVMLDASCYGGHHTFADSANNGPRGTALVQEFIPALEAAFRFAPAPHGRFVTGHSSGGWASLWLQVAYPDFFGGTWSTAPDSVDFSRFQNIDVYAPDANMYRDYNGGRAAVAQRGGEAFAWVDDFIRMETVLGEGGQLRSFEWVFSPRGADGLPAPIFDRTTGAIDPVIAEAWKPYDIRLKLERNWAELGPKLAGKLTVIMGDQDTFYLHHATIRLKEALARLGSDAVVEIIEGADHGSFMGPELFERIDREMVAAFERGADG